MSDHKHEFPTGGGGGHRGITLCELITVLEELHDKLLTDGPHCGLVCGMRFIHDGGDKPLLECDQGPDGSLWITVHE